MDKLTTKVFETEFGFGHYTVLIYDDKNYDLYEMSRPLDRNGINMKSDYGIIKGNNFISTPYGINYKNKFGKEITIDELMDEKNLDIRTAIKNKHYRLLY